MRLGISALSTYDATKRTASYYASFFNDLIRSVIDIFSGDQEMWYFYDEFNLPVQASVVAAENRDIMGWTYLKRNKQFIHRCGSVASKAFEYPWLSATLVIPNIHEGEDPLKFDFSDFLEETSIHSDRKAIPTPNMLLAAWCIQNRRWLTISQRRGAYFEVITGEGEEMHVPAWINTIRGYGVWCQSIGKEFPKEDESSESEDETEEEQVAPAPSAEADTPETNKKTD